MQLPPGNCSLHPVAIEAVAEATKLSEVVASSRHRSKNVTGLHMSFATTLSNDLRFSR